MCFLAEIKLNLLRCHALFQQAPTFQPRNDFVSLFNALVTTHHASCHIQHHQMSMIPRLTPGRSSQTSFVTYETAFLRYPITLSLLAPPRISLQSFWLPQYIQPPYVAEEAMSPRKRIPSKEKQHLHHLKNQQQESAR